MFKALFRVFDYSGRSTRWEYWSFLIGLAVISAISGAAGEAYVENHRDQGFTIGNDVTVWLVLAFLIVVCLPFFALRVRRFHDFGWSGWATFLLIVPIVNIVIELMLLFRAPISPIVEYYAAPPPAPAQVHVHTSTVPSFTNRDLGDATAQIEKLADMHQRGLLTEQEFTQAKRKLLL